MPARATTVRTSLPTDLHGETRVCGTRVLLDLVAAALRGGATAEQIARELSGASLQEVHRLTAYYLTHAAEIDAGVLRRRAAVLAVRNEVRELVRVHGRRARPPVPGACWERR